MSTASEHGEFDAVRLLGNNTMQLVASCAFGVEINVIDGQGNHTFKKHALDVFTVSPLRALAAFILPKFINKAIGVKTIFGQKGTDYIIELARQIIYHRKSSMDNSIQYNDFLQLLINTEISEQDDNKQDLNYLDNSGSNLQ